MPESAIAIVGLPGSGKTTFLAALWHLVTSREIETTLQFGTLKSGEQSHLNDIATRWRDALAQDRTAVGGDHEVGMTLKNAAEVSVRLTFPDLAGESFRRMWEERDCDAQVSRWLAQGAIILFIHADAIETPSWVIDNVTLSRRMGLEVEEGQPVEWRPCLAPTQVQLVDILQLLCEKPLDIGPRKIAIMLSAWDIAQHEGLPPQAYLAQKLPLLNQYLSHGDHGWEWRVYGLSAQGGTYETPDELRGVNTPSTRIQLTHDESSTHDLTEPLAWLMS